MINFNEEIKKYGQILEMDEIEQSIHSTELKDIMDMLNYIAKSRETSKTSVTVEKNSLGENK
ncbi:MAG: hypothetical protein VB018_04590 [Lachnospiraceae bacterium]|nr:hypothetical protein [Lachnospiraceae bacterium]